MCPLLSTPVVELYRLKLSHWSSLSPLCISIVGHLCTSIVMYNTVPLGGFAGLVGERQRGSREEDDEWFSCTVHGPLWWHGSIQYEAVCLLGLLCIYMVG